MQQDVANYTASHLSDKNAIVNEWELTSEAETAQSDAFLGNAELAWQASSQGVST